VHFRVFGGVFLHAQFLQQKVLKFTSNHSPSQSEVMNQRKHQMTDAMCWLTVLLACVYLCVGIYCRYGNRGSPSLSPFLRGGANSSNGSSKAAGRGNQGANHDTRWSLRALLACVHVCAGLCCLVWFCQNSIVNTLCPIAVSFSLYFCVFLSLCGDALTGMLL